MKCIKVVLSNCKIVCLLLILSGCGVKNLRPEKYIQWVEEPGNGLSIHKDFDNVGFQVLYKPANYIIAKELLNGGIRQEQVKERYEELGNMSYFTLSIKANSSNELLSADIKDESEYNQRLEYFMGSMQDDIMLVQGKDTLPCALFHFERSYGLAPYNNFVIAFAGTDKPLEDKVLVYEDRVLGTGKVMFKIRSNDLKNIPNIVWQ